MDKLFKWEHFLSREQTAEQTKQTTTNPLTLGNYLGSWDIILYQAWLQNKVKLLGRIWTECVSRSHSLSWIRPWLSFLNNRLYSWSYHPGASSWDLQRQKRPRVKYEYHLYFTGKQPVHREIKFPRPRPAKLLLVDLSSQLLQVSFRFWKRWIFILQGPSCFCRAECLEKTSPVYVLEEVLQQLKYSFRSSCIVTGSEEKCGF